MKKNSLSTRGMALLGSLLCAVSAATAADIELYEHDHFEGARMEAHSAVENFARHGFNDMASSVVIHRGVWQLCVDASFRGRCETLGPGRHGRLRDLRLNDAVSSIRPVRHGGGAGHEGGHGRGGALVLFRHDGYEGRSVALDGPEHDFSHFGLNDEVSSVVIESGRWLLCTDAHFQGRCVSLGPGSYASLRAYGLNDKLSSARPARGGDGRLPPPRGYGRGPGPGRATGACADALGQAIGRDHPRASRVELFDGEVEEQRVSDDEIEVRGAGQFETPRALRPFRFTCRYDRNSGDVNSLAYD
ncbi:beta/gamma crystallin family protein [Aquabacterium sp. A7-Y]|uniref:beta/gamma crystallin-related protein n=1 Tax=Aquabacterium sp. A7-Y TaxID=1349605 RepID=UPI00223E7290|nr:beta/gamma crystallin-related protein [Aquabacterium sp. A7-Y]MCW7538636.1 beta/gamma crystallin family protein [Aquabacterium sp. A7-Y]